ncbi:hypothetical protein [Nitrosovibrio sp. Nv6]|uniref:hypothetical protein n=1 Tax=Nitrosovibrio sp. Nv6 TaxID=1855340 RepID=UPI000B84310F|nr:hypothetical protein [Nitrosovibrio sp. Nv6]
MAAYDTGKGLPGQTDRDSEAGVLPKNRFGHTAIHPFYPVFITGSISKGDIGLTAASGKK